TDVAQTIFPEIRDVTALDRDLTPILLFRFEQPFSRQAPPPVRKASTMPVRRPRGQRRPLVPTAAAFGATALATVPATPGGTPAQATPTSPTTLVVSANQTLRSVTHVATGSLYGLASSSTPADSLVQPLKPNTFVQMAPGGKQLPNGEPAPAGD